MNMLSLSEGDVYLSLSDSKKIKIGKLENDVYLKHENFSGLFNKYQAWTIHNAVLHLCSSIQIIVTEDKDSTDSEKVVYTFTISTADIFKRHPRTFDSKVILPLHWFTVTVTNDSKASKLIERLGIEWYLKLRYEFTQKYMKDLSTFLETERKTHTVYPSAANVFRAFKTIPFSTVKVVILGQDPYHNGYADGLAFSSLSELFIPASLKNIFKEIEDDVYGGLMLNSDPRLDRWATQGVMLLNTCLTVKEHEAFSHQGKGWEDFTSKAIESLYEVKRPIVWMLWGKAAQTSFDKVITKYGQINDQHLVLRAAHPSPFSASQFFGCKHFSKCNQFLTSKQLSAIEW